MSGSRQRPAPPLPGDTPLPQLHPRQRQALSQAQRRWQSEFGTGSQWALSHAARVALGQTHAASTSEHAHLVCNEVETAHIARFGRAALNEERIDERARDQAALADAALVGYQDKWQRGVTRMQQAYPERWHVPGLSAEEVRDALTLHLIEAVRGECEDQLSYYRPGKAWGLLLVQRQVSVLRKSFRIGAQLMDLQDAPLEAPSASQEDEFIQREAAERRSTAHAIAEQQLTTRQRRWFEAMQHAARSGEFFETSSRLNLSAASRLLGKHRSSAQRAYQELGTHFRRELRRREW